MDILFSKSHRDSEAIKWISRFSGVRPAGLSRANGQRSTGRISVDLEDMPKGSCKFNLADMLHSEARLRVCPTSRNHAQISLNHSTRGGLPIVLSPNSHSRSVAMQATNEAQLRLDQQSEFQLHDWVCTALQLRNRAIRYFKSGSSFPQTI